MGAVEGGHTLVCRSYTHARRHPILLGKIGGFAFVPMTPTQVVVLATSFLTLVATRGLWAHFDWATNAAIAIGVPGGLSWLVRQVRFEGRSPLRTAAGVAAWALAPRRGTCQGRPYRTARPQRLTARRLFICELAEHVDLGGELAAGGPSLPPQASRGWARLSEAA